MSYQADESSPSKYLFPSLIFGAAVAATIYNLQSPNLCTYRVEVSAPRTEVRELRLPEDLSNDEIERQARQLWGNIDILHVSTLFLRT
jgi:hypothetical protein